MFTLKLFRVNGPDTDKTTTKVIAAHRVIVHDIGGKGHPKSALEIVAFMSDQNKASEVYYVGTPEEPMEAFGRHDLHLNNEAGSWWGWGLLENWEGNTTEVYRPTPIR